MSAGGQPAVRPAGFFALRRLGAVGFAAQLVDDVLDRLAHAHEASPACAATTTSVTLPSPTVLGSTIATWAGLMKTSPPAAWRLNCTRFIGCPRFRRGCVLQLTDLAGCPTVVDASARARGREPCAPARPGNCRGQPGRKSLLDVARTRAELGGVRTAGACGFRPVRIDRIGRAAAESGDFRPRGDPETAALSDFVALERAPGRLRARLGGHGTLPVDDADSERGGPQARLAGVGGGHERGSTSGGGGELSGRRLLGAHLPAASPERRETVAGECLGCMTQFAVDVRLPLPALCPGLRGRRALPRGHRGRNRVGPAALRRTGWPEGETMTVCVSSLLVNLRELIELAECDEDAELVAALHDAHEVASPSGWAAALQCNGVDDERRE